MYLNIYVYYHVRWVKMIRLFKILQNFKDIFNFFFKKKILGSQAPLVIKGLRHCVNNVTEGSQTCKVRVDGSGNCFCVALKDPLLQA